MHRNVLLKVAVTKIRSVDARLAAVERFAPPGSPLRAYLIRALAREVDDAKRMLEAAIPAYVRRRRPGMRHSAQAAP